jgi:hypothetical protein
MRDYVQYRHSGGAGGLAVVIEALEDCIDADAVGVTVMSSVVVFFSYLIEARGCFFFIGGEKAVADEPGFLYDEFAAGVVFDRVIRSRHGCNLNFQNFHAIKIFAVVSKRYSFAIRG